LKEKEKGGWLPIVGLILLIAVLFAGVKLVFAGLGYVIPQDEGPEETGTWYQMYNERGEAVRYTLREPGEIDLSAPDIAQWMEQAAGELEQTPETEGIVFWLYRQDTDEYLLYLPDQDRSLLEGGLTASEETEEDSEVCLVLRARRTASRWRRRRRCTASPLPPTAGTESGSESSWTAGSRRSAS